MYKKIQKQTFFCFQPKNKEMFSKSANSFLNFFKRILVIFIVFLFIVISTSSFPIFAFPHFPDKNSQPNSLKEIMVKKNEHFLEVKILCRGHKSVRKFELSNPNRIVVDFLGIEDTQTSRWIEINYLGIKAIRTGMFKTNTARVVFDLENKIPPYRVKKITQGVQVIFEQEKKPERKEEQEKKNNSKEEKSEPQEKKQEKEKTMNADKLFRRARCLAFKGNREKAKEILKEILAEKPDYYEVRVFLANVKVWEGEYDSARRELKKVLRKKPAHSSALHALVNVEYRSDSYSQALKYCNEGLNKYPQDEEFLLTKAKILEKMGDYSAASKVIDTILGVHPHHQESLQLRKKIKLLSLNNKFSLNYIYDRFERKDSDYGPWHLLSVGISRKFSFGTLIGKANFANRSFGTNHYSGVQFNVDAYPKFMEGLYSYWNIGYSSSSIFPKYRAGAELYKSLPLNFELSLGLRYLSFSESEVLIYTGYLGNYYKNYWLSFRPFVTSKPSGISFTGIFMVRRYWGNARNYLRRYWSTAATYVTFYFGYGSTPQEIYYLEDIERLNSFKVGFNIQKMITQNFSVKSRFKFEREEFRVGKMGNRFSLSVSLHYFF